MSSSAALYGSPSWLGQGGRMQVALPRALAPDSQRGWNPASLCQHPGSRPVRPAGAPFTNLHKGPVCKKAPQYVNYKMHFWPPAQRCPEAKLT